VSARTLQVSTWALVLTIAALAFLVSFESISAYSVQVGAFPASLRWCAPLMVDSFTLAACLVILARSRDGVRAVYAWTLVAVASAVSVALNVAHAPAHLDGRLVAALPPAALLASLELVMSEARRVRAVSRVVSDSPALSGPPGSADTPESGTARERLRAMLASVPPHQSLTGSEVAAQLGVSRGHAYALLRSERNGDGQ
jgi:Protein of unknown function (DUF2637)